MHFLMLLIAGCLAWGLRLWTWRDQSPLSWSKTLFRFVFPPLLLITTAWAIVSMGYQGTMFGLESGWLTFGLAIALVGCSLGVLIFRFYQARISLQQLQPYPQKSIHGQSARILNVSFPYSAQIGFWRSQLVISQGLIELLDSEHLEAVLAHEKAHANYRDTFWFFWLGWLRQITAWLPNSESLWQELLFLRELRADQKAVTQVDALVLAESLMLVAQQAHQTSPLTDLEVICATFYQENRLFVRINGLIDPSTQNRLTEMGWTRLFWLLVFIPLILIPLHY
jgi:Zn-dependent protease with chaperone function